MSDMGDIFPVSLFVCSRPPTHRHRSDRVQSASGDHPHGAGQALLAQTGPLEEDPVPAASAAHQDPQRGSTDLHLLCCGRQPGQGEWALLQVI